MRLRVGALSLLSAVVVLVTAPAPLSAFPHPSRSIGSGGVTGAYYAVSSAIAKVFNRKSPEHGMRLATVESAGPLANIDAVLLGKTAFGIAPADVLQRAAQAPGQNGLRAVLGLHVEAVTIVAARDRDIEGVGDLRGKRVNIGAPDTTDHEHAMLLLEAAGLLPAAVTLSERSAVPPSELLEDDKIDGYIYAVGHPNLSLLEASMGKRKVRLIPLDQPLIERATATNPLLLPAVIPTEYYPGLADQGPVPTIGMRAVLFTRADMAEETVYRLVREVLANFDLFQRQHPLLQRLTPREACGTTVIPAHPGAERSCRETGLTP